MPDESGRKVPNPISLVSQWKILDNLRRSLVEPATFLLLVFGWLVLPGNPFYWTLADPGHSVLCRHGASSGSIWCGPRLSANRKSSEDARAALLTANASMFFTLSFLPHQMLLSLDAVVRTLVRRLVTRRRLLEWETAAETELSTPQAHAGRHLSRLDARSGAGPGCSWCSSPAGRFFRRAADPVALGVQ